MNVRTDGLKRIFTGSIAVDLLQKALGLVNSVVLGHTLGAAGLGQYFWLIAAVAIVPGIANCLDQVLSRFLPTLENAERPRLAAIVLTTKLQASVVGFAVLSLVAWGTRESVAATSIDAWSRLWLVALLGWGVIPLVSNWCTRVLTGYQRYRIGLLADASQAIGTTLWLLFATLVMEFHDLFVLIFGMTCVVLIVALVKSYVVFTLERDLARSIAAALRTPFEGVRLLFGARYRGYALPFMVGGVSGIIKDQFPVLVLGIAANAPAVAEFRVVQQIFRLAHTVVPNAFELIRPALVLREASGKAIGASARYQRYAILYLLTATALSVSVALGLKFILALWSLEYSGAIQIACLLLALELLFASAAHVEFQILLLRDDISYVLYLSFTRQLITAGVILAVAGAWGQAGVAAGATAGALATWVGFVLYSRRQEVREAPHILAILWVTLAMICVITAANIGAYRLYF